MGTSKYLLQYTLYSVVYCNKLCMSVAQLIYTGENLMVHWSFKVTASTFHHSSILRVARGA